MYGAPGKDVDVLKVGRAFERRAAVRGMLRPYMVPKMDLEAFVGRREEE